MDKLSVVFWPHTVDANVASFRIRCKTIVESLAGIEQNISYSYSIDCPSNADLLILSKRYDKKSVGQALKLKEKYSTRIFLDLCDNHFLIDSQTGTLSERALQLIDAVNKVDGVIASTEYLAQLIKSNCGDEISIFVIGDVVEIPKLDNTNNFSNCIANYKYRRFLKKIDRLMPNHSRRLVWFGNHQGSFSESGMSDLNLIKNEIEAIHAKDPVSLTIISNSEKKFKSIFKNWETKCFYVEWNRNNFSKILQLHSVSIIPASKNEFTYAKTDNRVTASLIHGLQVVADPIPSYLEHSNRIFINSWKDSLRSALNPALKRINDFEPQVHNANMIKKWNSLTKKIISNG